MADRGYETPEGDYHERMVQDMVKRINDAKLGPILGKRPDVTAEAIRRTSPGLPAALLSEWMGDNRETILLMADELRKEQKRFEEEDDPEDPAYEF
jgi:hypothetical protein